jgi:hypothetical protein
LAVCAILVAFLGGCAVFGGVASRPVPQSEVARLRALPDYKEAFIVAPIFTNDAMQTISRLQQELDSKP